MTLLVSAKTQPDNKEILCDAENKLLALLSNEKELETLAQKLSTEFKATVKLNSVRMGTVKVDMLLGDLTRLEYLKELSDKWVLSNIVDRILITPDFIESCLAEDVAIDVVVEEESYQKAKLDACK